MRQIAFIILSISLLWACGGAEEKFQSERDSLQTVISEREEALTEFMQSFNEIQENLETIKEKESIIKVNASTDVELQQSDKDKINDDILTIYKLLIENKQTVESLKKKLRNSNIKIREFQRMVDNLNKQIQKKDEEIMVLKQQLADYKIDIDELNIQIKQLNYNLDSMTVATQNQQEVIEQQDEEINTAFYVFGSKKELKKNQVITKSGGLVGLVGLKKLSNNFDSDYFTKIDIREVTSIPLLSKKATVLTNHPADSYRIAGDGKADSLVIESPKKFWSISKYLVIQVN